MIKYVDYDKDIKEPFEAVLRGAYNKANIWVKDIDTYNKDYIGFKILKEELEEVEQAYIGFKNYTTGCGATLAYVLPMDIHGHVLSLVSELLQVLAVCNKYWPEIYGSEEND